MQQKPDNVELPVVTVVIPNYNYAKWLPEALASVAIQDYPNKQAVIIDDCSTDDSFDTICKLIKDRQEINTSEGSGIIGIFDGMPVTVISMKQNSGRSHARNTGIQLAWDVTHIFGFLDSDDLYMPGKISKSVGIILEDPNTVGAVYSDYDTLHVKTGLVVREFKEPYSRERLVQECIVNNDSIISKLALDKCGLYYEGLSTCEDFDLWLRISEQFLIAHIPDALVTVRVTGEGASFSVPTEDWKKNHALVMERLKVRVNA